MLSRLWFLGLILAASVVAIWPPPPENPKPLVGRLFEVVQASFTGKRPAEFYALRDEDDKASGTIRLTDENYHELVEEGPADTVWVVNVHAEKIIEHQAFFDAHTNATRLFPTIHVLGVAADKNTNGKQIKFARLDFQAEWKTCTRWLLFKPPRLVFVTDNGKTVRTLGEREIVPDGERLAKWLKDGEWKDVQVWDGSFAPGGDLQWLIERYISFFTLTSRIRTIPPIVWMTLSGLIGRYLLEWFWGSNPSGAPAPAKQGSGEGTKPVISEAAVRRYAGVAKKRHAAGAKSQEK